MMKRPLKGYNKATEFDDAELIVYKVFVVPGSGGC